MPAEISPIMTNDVSIVRVDSAKLLGVTVSSDLTWETTLML